MTSLILKKLWEYVYYSLIDPYADVSYGYCITTHKCQGSTYNNVYVDIGNILNCNKNNLDSLKCLYTAVTRASDTISLFY